MKAVEVRSLRAETAHGLPEPYASRLGPYEGRSLGDVFELTQFGAVIDTLAPGSQSSLRHWHTRSDELVLVMDGTLVLVTNDGETTIGAGMCVGFKAGDDNAHHLQNRSDAPATYLVVGSRVEGDRVHYPDDDVKWVKGDDGRWFAARKDGSSL